MDDLSRFRCLNSDCPEHGKRGAGNLTVTGRCGPDKSRRMLRCNARFSGRKGTPLFDIPSRRDHFEWDGNRLEHGGPARQLVACLVVGRGSNLSLALGGSSGDPDPAD
jgi:hypothetical protein